MLLHVYVNAGEVHTGACYDHLRLETGADLNACKRLRSNPIVNSICGPPLTDLLKCSLCLLLVTRLCILDYDDVCMHSDMPERNSKWCVLFNVLSKFLVEIQALQNKGTRVVFVLVECFGWVMDSCVWT